MPNLILRWGPALLMMIVIFAASATPGNELPEFGKIDTGVKKGGHMFGYALLGIAYLRGVANRKSATRWQIVLAVTMAFLYASTDEFHQIFTPGRTPSPYDVGIDTFGAILGVTLWTALRRRLCV